MRRYPSRGPSYSSFSFGPGPLSPAIKALIAVNVAVFLVMWVMPAGLSQAVQEFLGLLPASIFRVVPRVAARHLHVPARHACHRAHPLQHARAVDVRYRARADVGHEGVSPVLLRDGHRGGDDDDPRVACCRFPSTARMFYTVTIGASGAIYGLLLAYGLTFPNRPIYIYFVFPIPAKYFVMIMGAIALLSSMGDGGGGIAHITHLGGLVAGFVMLRGRRLSPANEVRYRYLRWKMDRARKKFGVYSGGKKRLGQACALKAETEKRTEISPCSTRSAFFVFRFCALSTDHQRQQARRRAATRSHPSDRRTGTSTRLPAAGSARRRAPRLRRSSSRIRARAPRRQASRLAGPGAQTRARRE